VVSFVALAQELRAAFDREARRSAFILGEDVERFEAGFAEPCSVRHMASGSTALTSAMIAAGIGSGDEVIVPAHTFISSALAVVHAGATVVFCDVERDNGLIDVVAAAARVGPHPPRSARAPVKAERATPTPSAPSLRSTTY
jgi:dTDP-4-amino-4,6-dideoxygalactose transaminase